MLLIEYQTTVLAVIQKYVNNDWITSFSFSIDARSSYIGFLQGDIEFCNDSHLFFKEYCDSRELDKKLSYSFHYQNCNNELIFRYDNSKHKPDLGFIEHKHIKEKIISAKAPSIEEVILEIINCYL